ncbi:MAG: CCA tRNA nucleotidyltransferase [Pseudomonadota bacterium]
MTQPDHVEKLAPDRRGAFSWLRSPALRRVTDALEAAAPGGARFVGGCVRDSLLGETPKDFDIATTLLPDAVMRAAAAANLKTVPTGIEHGTVTVIVDHQGVEVTTLRADVSTDGRRASVAFTEDWAVDAGRRDFTVNAIYVSPDGAILDPVGGLGDIKAARIRFIGLAQERIREDYLRILRFFRFSARFSENLDQDGLSACVACRSGVKSLSAERIGAEMMAILRLPRADFAIQGMRETGVLSEIWDKAPDIAALKAIKAIAPDAPAPIVLSALFPAVDDGLGAALRLSNAEKAMRARALRAEAEISHLLSERALRRLAYHHGREAMLDGLALAAARGGISRENRARLAENLLSSPVAKFPLTGKDVVAKGVKPGPAVSKILAKTEAQWIDEDFPDSERLAEILDAAMASA